jgi:hypothetical protein
LAGVAGLYVAEGLTGMLGQVAPSLPPLVGGTMFASLAGFFLAVGDLGTRLTVSRDPVSAAYAETQPVLSGELHTLADQALKTRADITQAIAATRSELDGQTRIPRELITNVDEVLLRTLALARRCADLESEMGRTPPSELCERLERLDQKIAGTDDTVAREQYQMAKSALAAQLAYRQQIERGRERVVARLHTDLAELEKVRLAIVRARSMDAGAAAEALAPLVEHLKGVGDDLNLTSEALGEAARADTATPPASAT